MRREQHRDTLVGDDPVEKCDDFLTTFQVEVGERLVEKQQPRPADESVGDQDPLLLSSRQAPHTGVAEALCVYGREHPVHCILAVLRRDRDPEPVPVHTECHEVPSPKWHVRIERHLLWHVSDRPVPSAGWRPVEKDPAARRTNESEDDSQQSRLSRPVRSDQARELAGIQAECHVLENCVGPTSKH